MLKTKQIEIKPAKANRFQTMLLFACFCSLSASEIF
jgi:hypothetical protein